MERLTDAEIESLCADLCHNQWDNAADAITQLQAERDAAYARNDAMQGGLEFTECAYNHDTVTDVCLGHKPIVDAIVAKRHAALIADNARLREAADNWNALMSCQRIRMMGATFDLNHIGMEFWREHESKHPSAEFPQEPSRERFLAFIAALRAALGAS